MKHHHPGDPMSPEMHGGSRPASPRLSTAESGTQVELSPESQEQLAQAMEQKGLYISRMAKKAGAHLAEDMWANIMVSLSVRLANLGPVDDLPPYLNSCVSNQLRSLRATVVTLVSDENLDLHRDGVDLDLGEALHLNAELIDLVGKIRATGILMPDEMDAWVLLQVLDQDLITAAAWFDPPMTVRHVGRVARRAAKKVKKAYEGGKFAALGYGPTPPVQRPPKD